MQISSRFTEYGLTGGLFWICQVILLWWSGQTQTVLSNLSTVQLQIPPGISQVGSTVIMSLIGALAIVSVFLAGLLLDLFAAYFRPMEMRVFSRHLDRNRDWLGRLIADHKGYCEADYNEFERRRFGEFAKEMLAGLDAFMFWSRDRRQRYRAALKRGWGWNLTRPYERLWSFFTSYVVVLSGSSQLNLMVDQYYLWRAGRAVSVVLTIAFLEVQFLVVMHGLFRTSSFTPIFLLGPLLPLGVLIFSMMITLGTYSRLCFTLFALVYVTQDKRNAELNKEAHAASPTPSPEAS